MRLGALLPIPEMPGSIGPRTIAESARQVQAAGYDSIWVFDCIARGLTIPDPFVALAVAASVTEDIELGSGIVQVPLRNTVALAHAALSTHLVCGDRFLFGVGYGSTKADLDAVGASFEERRALFEAAMPDLRTLMASGLGGGADLSPWPLHKPGPPLLLGTWGRHVVTAAHDYDGWIGSEHYRSATQLIESLKVYRDAGGQRALVTNIAVPDQADLSATADKLALLAEAGFDDAVLFFANATDETLAKVRSFVPRSATKATR